MKSARNFGRRERSNPPSSLLERQADVAQPEHADACVVAAELLEQGLQVRAHGGRDDSVAARAAWGQTLVDNSYPRVNRTTIPDRVIHKGLTPKIAGLCVECRA